MGPRLDRRGNWSASSSSGINRLLQWGHAWIGVGMALQEALRAAKAAASMGPRLDRRGNMTGSSPRTSREKSLQWGHAWIGVGINGISQSIDPVPGLQWGHAWIGVGIGPGFSGLSQCPRASMGPRLDRRGNADEAGNPVLIDWASMGPRLDRRGNACIPLSDAFRDAELQWGHAWIGVGIGQSNAGRRRCRSFNGATPG